MLMTTFKGAAKAKFKAWTKCRTILRPTKGIMTILGYIAWTFLPLLLIDTVAAFTPPNPWLIAFGVLALVWCVYWIQVGFRRITD